MIRSLLVFAAVFLACDTYAGEIVLPTKNVPTITVVQDDVTGAVIAVRVGKLVLSFDGVVPPPDQGPPSGDDPDANLPDWMQTALIDVRSLPATAKAKLPALEDAYREMITKIKAGTISVTDVETVGDAKINKIAFDQRVLNATAMGDQAAVFRPIFDDHVNPYLTSEAVAGRMQTKEQVIANWTLVALLFDLGAK